MKPIREMWCCHIEITNKCPHNCVYCSRWSRHIKPEDRFDMTPAQVEAAFDSLEGWPGKIGIMGGEPTMHPQFAEICAIVRRCKGNHLVDLWTSGGAGYEAHRHTIMETFDYVAFNDHSDAACRHQPITVASCDAVPDEAFRAWLIDNCWVQRCWCPSIGNNGAYFCEVAYAIDTVFGLNSGWKVERDWWKREPPFGDQTRACQFCGMCVPMETEPVTAKRQKMSPTIARLLRERGANLGPVEYFFDTFTPEQLKALIPTWQPAHYKPGMINGGLL